MATVARRRRHRPCSRIKEREALGPAVLLADTVDDGHHLAHGSLDASDTLCSSWVRSSSLNAGARRIARPSRYARIDGGQGGFQVVTQVIHGIEGRSVRGVIGREHRVPEYLP